MTIKPLNLNRVRYCVKLADKTLIQQLPVLTTFGQDFLNNQSKKNLKK